MTEKIILRKGTRQRLELSMADLEILAFLEQQRMLTVQQLYQVSTILFNLEIQDYSFKNRIRKWEEYKLIRSGFYSNGFDGERFKYLCIGSKAIDLLIEYKMLEPTYNKQKIYKFHQKKNVIHFLATQQAVLNILFDLNGKKILSADGTQERYEIIYNVNLFSHSPSMWPYQMWIPEYKNLHRQNKGAYHAQISKFMSNNDSKNRNNGKTMTIVIPDWIVRLIDENGKEIFFNIELDTGSEPIETIIQKVFKYALLAEYNPSEQHYMYITIADYSFSNRSRFSNGLERSKNIMNKILADDILRERIYNSGFFPLVYPLRLINLKLIELLTNHS